MKTNQQKLISSLYWYLLRKLWLLGSILSKWAGKTMVELTCKADEIDYNKPTNN
jgi:hypothetical protein